MAIGILFEFVGKGALISQTRKQIPAMCGSALGPLRAQRCSDQELRHPEVGFPSSGYQRLRNHLISYLYLCP